MSRYALVLNLRNQIEEFLDLWVREMSDAGYLEFTTAKREDCIRSFYGFLTPVFDYLEQQQELPAYGQMLLNKDDWAKDLIQFAKRHRARGISVDMFQGCFKTLIHSLEQLVLTMDGPVDQKLDAIQMIRRWSDGAEILMLADWKMMGQLEAVERLAESNRELTLEKNKYENILEATSDMVLVTDPEGAISEANTEAKIVLKNRDLAGRFVGEVLGLGLRTIDELLDQFDVKEFHEIRLHGDPTVYHLRIIPLQTVSLASRGYMLLLSDIHRLVSQRESLKQQVTEQISALADSEKQFTALFQNAGESILLVDGQLNIVETNNKASIDFGLGYSELLNTSFKELCVDERVQELPGKVNNLEMGENWEGELVGKRANGETFPMSATINRVELVTGPVIQILLKDITRQKELEQNLNREKSRLEDLNITLRTVLQSINEKNSEYQQEIFQTVKDVVLPALDKIGKETDSHIRENYLMLVKDQLMRLTGDTDGANDTHLLKLSPTELKICQFIQAGNATKEIAETLGLSVDTVQTHRKNIRKKLGIQGRDVSLFNYLNSPDKTNLVESPVA